MNDDPLTKEPNSMGRRITFVLSMWLFLIIGIMSSGSCVHISGNKKQAESETIIQTIKLGLELEMANRGVMPSLAFDSLCAAFARSSALTDLKSLKAIDEQRKCFVDAWGHRLSITTGELNRIVVISPRKDGLMETSDDIR